jgi:cysteine desulfurase/selenocysteine lyase
MNVNEGDATEATGTRHARLRWLRLSALSREPLKPPLDAGHPGHFAFPGLGRVVTNNAASTQPPRSWWRCISCWRRGMRTCTGAVGCVAGDDRAVRGVHDTIARFIAPGRAHRAVPNTTEAINAVMYSLLTEFRDGDNVVTTAMEHNPTTSRGTMCREILPRLGRRADYRLPASIRSPASSPDHLASPIDARTKLCAAPGRRTSSAISHPAGGRPRWPTPAGTPARRGAALPPLVDGAQLVPILRRRAP